jgi:hypothetical protein
MTRGLPRYYYVSEMQMANGAITPPMSQIMGKEREKKKRKEKREEKNKKIVIEITQEWRLLLFSLRYVLPTVNKALSDGECLLFLVQLDEARGNKRERKDFTKRDPPREQVATFTKYKRGNV